MLNLDLVPYRLIILNTNPPRRKRETQISKRELTLWNSNSMQNPNFLLLLNTNNVNSTLTTIDLQPRNTSKISIISMRLSIEQTSGLVKISKSLANNSSIIPTFLHYGWNLISPPFFCWRTPEKYSMAIAKRKGDIGSPCLRPLVGKGLDGKPLIRTVRKWRNAPHNPLNKLIR